MSRKKSGRIEVIEHHSKILADNPLRDPSIRRLPVYLPPSHDSARRSKRRYPVLFDLVGYTGSGWSHVNWRNFEESVPEQLDRLIDSGTMPPCVVVFPDCFTALGGNQYVNSSAIGNYADYLTRELIPTVDAEFKTLSSREHRGCFGKSSGGYGAMVHGMKYARYWGGIGNHSGDAYFDFVYRSEWPAVLTALQAFAKPALRDGQRRQVNAASPEGYDDGRVAGFLSAFANKQKPSGQDVMTLMMICMAATYDPDPQAPNGFRLPFDLHTGEFLPERWRVWLRHDPINMVKRYRKNLKSLRGIYIDCGWRDQYHIHFGSRQLSQALNAQQIVHRYEEFDDTHSGIDYRMDRSLPFLAKRLS